MVLFLQYGAVQISVWRPTERQSTMQLWRTLTVVNAAVLLDGHDLKTLDPTWLRCVLMRVAGFARSDRCLGPAVPHVRLSFCITLPCSNAFLGQLLRISSSPDLFIGSCVVSPDCPYPSLSICFVSLACPHLSLCARPSLWHCPSSWYCLVDFPLLSTASTLADVACAG